jgi:hypothetical protein
MTRLARGVKCKPVSEPWEVAGLAPLSEASNDASAAVPIALAPRPKKCRRVTVFVTSWLTLLPPRNRLVEIQDDARHQGIGCQFGLVQ